MIILTSASYSNDDTAFVCLQLDNLPVSISLEFWHLSTLFETIDSHFRGCKIWWKNPCNSDVWNIFSFEFAHKLAQIVACDVKLSNAFRVVVCVLHWNTRLHKELWYTWSVRFWQPHHTIPQHRPGGPIITALCEPSIGTLVQIHALPSTPLVHCKSLGSSSTCLLPSCNRNITVFISICYSSETLSLYPNSFWKRRSWASSWHR